jgi:hypothetical protein
MSFGTDSKRGNAAWRAMPEAEKQKAGLMAGSDFGYAARISAAR